MIVLIYVIDILDLYLSLFFFQFFFWLLLTFFVCLHKLLLIYLIRYLQRLFNLHFEFFYVKENIFK